MATMKIGSISQTYANATFSFPNNPRAVDVPFEKNDQMKPIPFSKTHILIGAGGVATRNLVFQGEMFGASRLANLNSLMTELADNDIKRFWVSGTRFYYVSGMTLKHTYQGGRTNFIDYVLSMNAVLPFAYDSTENTYTWTNSTATKTTLNDATGGSAGAFSNDGNAPAFVKWTIVNTAGSAITKIEIGDSSDFSTSPHKITWTGSLASGVTLVIGIFKYVAQGVRGTFKVLEFAYPYNLSGEAKLGNVQIHGDQVPWVDAGSSDQSFDIRLTGNDAAATVTANWYDAYFIG